MFKHILIATDGSDIAWRAVTKGLQLAKDVSAKVTIVTVTELWSAKDMSSDFSRIGPSPIEKYEEKMAEYATRTLRAVTDYAAKLGVACDAVHVPDRRPAEGIVDTALERACDLICMASHGRRGISRLMLGSQSNEVVATTTLPVLIFR